MEYIYLLPPLAIIGISIGVGGVLGSFWMFCRMHNDCSLLEVDLEIAHEKLEEYKQIIAEYEQ